MDVDLASDVEAELGRHGVRVRTSTTVTAITRAAHGLTVSGHASDDHAAPFSVTVVVLVVVGSVWTPRSLRPRLWRWGSEGR